MFRNADADAAANAELTEYVRKQIGSACANVRRMRCDADMEVRSLVSCEMLVRCCQFVLDGIG